MRLISIHALREEGDFEREAGEARPDISIHALREEGDRRRVERWINQNVFLYTPSARRATEQPILQGVANKFLSTPSARRATRIGCDVVESVAISIHALREEGDHRLPKMPSTHSISIHALREEGDFRILRHVFSSKYFYPRPPRGGRP